MWHINIHGVPLQIQHTGEPIEGIVAVRQFPLLAEAGDLFPLQIREPVIQWEIRNEIIIHFWPGCERAP
jgi:hypothetical protein